METSLWSYEGQSCGGIQQREGIVPISLGCWYRRCKGMSQVPDWFAQFDHQSEGDRQWTTKCHI